MSDRAKEHTRPLLIEAQIDLLSPTVYVCPLRLQAQRSHMPIPVLKPLVVSTETLECPILYMKRFQRGLPATDAPQRRVEDRVKY